MCEGYSFLFLKDERCKLGYGVVPNNPFYRVREDPIQNKMKRRLETPNDFHDVSAKKKGYVLTHSPARSQKRRNTIHHPECSYLSRCYSLHQDPDGKIVHSNKQEYYHYTFIDELKKDYENAKSCPQKLCKERCKD